MSIDAIVSDKRFGNHSYILWFGACAATNVLVYADSLEDALEDAARELVAHGWMGLFTDPDYEDAFNDLQRSTDRIVKYPDGQSCIFPIIAEKTATISNHCSQHNSPRARIYPCYACDASIQEVCPIPDNFSFEADFAAHGVIDPVSERIISDAEADLTYTESGYIASWEWGIVAEDPTPQEISRIAHGYEHSDGCVLHGYRYSDGSVWTGTTHHDHVLRQNRKRKEAIEAERRAEFNLRLKEVSQ